MDWPVNSRSFTYINQVLLSFYANFITAFQHICHIFFEYQIDIKSLIENSSDIRSSCYLPLFKCHWLLLVRTWYKNLAVIDCYWSQIVSYESRKF